MRSDMDADADIKKAGGNASSSAGNWPTDRRAPAESSCEIETVGQRQAIPDNGFLTIFANRGTPGRSLIREKLFKAGVRWIYTSRGDRSLAQTCNG